MNGNLIAGSLFLFSRRTLHHGLYQTTRSIASTCQHTQASQPPGPSDVSAHKNTEVPENVSTSKPIRQMPGPSIFRTLWDVVFTNKYTGKRHVFLHDRSVEFGSVYREFNMSNNAVVVTDPEIAGDVLRSEGRFPRRIIIDSWREWRDKNGHSRGVFTQDGEEWWKWRKVLDQQMMKPVSVASYTDCLNDVATDFIIRLQDVRQKHGATSPVRNLQQELFNWSMESICATLFERRFGCFGTLEPDIEQIIQGVVDVFESTEVIIDYPYKVARFLKPAEYKKHNHGFEVTMRLGKKIIDSKIEQIKTASERGEQLDGFLSRLIASKTLTQHELYGNVVELMAGAIDTTSTAMLWAIYYLSRNPDVQERLVTEINQVLPDKIPPGYDDLKNVPFLKAVVKETMRLSPPVWAISRYMATDIILNGFLVPEGTLVILPTYTMGHDPKIFTNPETFEPERWLRSHNKKERQRLHSFSSIPFGFGPRMCIGRRVAELEMYILLIRLLQQFVIEATTGEKIPPRSAGIMQPSRPVRVRLLDRK